MSLLQLPLEIRLRIYDLLFTVPYTIIFNNAQNVGWRYHPYPPWNRCSRLNMRAIALLRTCRTIHAEAAPVLYQNQFLVETGMCDWDGLASVVQCFFCTVGSTNARCITRLRLPVHSYTTVAAMERQGTADGLRRIRDGCPNLRRLELWPDDRHASIAPTAQYEQVFQQVVPWLLDLAGSIFGSAVTVIARTRDSVRNF